MFRTGCVRPAVIIKAARFSPSQRRDNPGQAREERRYSSPFPFMRIAVDVMGGDHGCAVVIDGIKLALQSDQQIKELYIVGDQTEINAALARGRWRDPRVHVLHASEVLTMQDKPALALRRKKDCSVARAVDLVKEGRADAVISPGNT